MELNWNLSPSLTCCVTLGNRSHYSEPQFSPPGKWASSPVQCGHTGDPWSQADSQQSVHIRWIPPILGVTLSALTGFSSLSDTISILQKGTSPAGS
jgi:hypothetical protein